MDGTLYWSEKYQQFFPKTPDDNITDINENEPHCVSELICVRCGKRWIGVYPEKTWLKEIECENCGTGFVIKTGQDLEETE